jgi:hypothetical protein
MNDSIHAATHAHRRFLISHIAVDDLNASGDMT